MTAFSPTILALGPQVFRSAKDNSKLTLPLFPMAPLVKPMILLQLRQSEERRLYLEAAHTIGLSQMPRLPWMFPISLENYTVSLSQRERSLLLLTSPIWPEQLSANR